MKPLRSTCCVVLCGLFLSYGSLALAQTDNHVDKTDAAAVQRPSWDKIESEILPPREQVADASHEKNAAANATAKSDVDKPLQNRDREKQPIQRSPATVTTGGSWTRTLFSLGAVIGLVLLLAWGYRNAAMGTNPLTSRVRTGGVIQVVGRQSISPRHAVCLLRVGPRLVLVGQSQDRLTQLDVIDDAAIVAQLVGESSATLGRREAAAFQKQLESEAAEYEQRDAHAASAPIQGVLQRMQAALKQAAGSKS